MAKRGYNMKAWDKIRACIALNGIIKEAKQGLRDNKQDVALHKIKERLNWIELNIPAQK